MLRNPRLSPSTSTSEQAASKGIFSFTEIIPFPGGFEKPSFSLPKLMSPVSSSAVSSPVMKARKVIRHAKASSLSSLPTSRSPSMLSAIDTGKRLVERLDREAQEEFLAEQSHPEKQLEKVRRLEMMPLAAKEVSLAKKAVIDSKASLDELRLLRGRKGRQLETLCGEKEKLTEMLSGEEQIEEKLQYVIQLEAEFEETMQGCRNENHYSETLLHMIETRKLCALAKMKPLRKLRDALRAVDVELQSATKREMETKVELDTFLMRCGEIEGKIDSEKKNADFVLGELGEKYKEKQKMLLFLQKERADLNQQRRLVELEKMSKRLQERLEHLQEAENFQEEVKHLEQRGKIEERKFKEVARKTSITSILDMESYWKYLTANKASLETIVETSQRHIERLTKERDDEKKRFSELDEDKDEDSQLTSQEIAYMNEKLNSKIKDLEVGEENLAVLTNLVTSATNSISSIAHNTLDRLDELNVKPSNAAQCLETCCEVLENALKGAPRSPLPRPIVRKGTLRAHGDCEPPTPTGSSGNFLQVSDKSASRGRKFSRRTSMALSM